MEEKICCLTGHRNISKEMETTLITALSRKIETLILQGYCHFRTGAAPGFDTLAARMVLLMREVYPRVCLHLYLPYMGQSQGWKEKERREYREIFERADAVSFISEEYEEGCMQKRNESMAEGCHLCTCFLTKEEGGTYDVVQYCQKLQIPVENLADKITIV